MRMMAYAAALIAQTIITTAITYSTISRPVLRRATSCRSKKSIEGWLPAERHLDCFALLRIVELEQGRLVEPEHWREDPGRKAQAVGVVLHHRVVVRLPRERDAVFGAGEFFHQPGGGLIGFELRVVFADHEESRQSCG